MNPAIRPENAPSKEDVLIALREAWGPLPIPPPEELFDLEWGYGGEDYEAFAGKLWDAPRSEILPKYAFYALRAHRAYYYGTLLLQLFKISDPWSRLAIIEELDDKELRDCLFPEQKRAAIVASHWCLSRLPINFLKKHCHTVTQLYGYQCLSPYFKEDRLWDKKEFVERILRILKESEVLSKLQVLDLVHKGWDPLPIPPAEELVDPYWLVVGGWDQIDCYETFAGKRWNEFGEWLDTEAYCYLEAHKSYYYASYIPTHMNLDREVLSQFINQLIMPLNDSSFIDSMDPDQRLAAIAVVEWFFREAPESIDHYCCFPFHDLNGYLWLKRWQAKAEL